MGRPVLKEQHVRSANIPRVGQVDEAKVHSVSTRALLREQDSSTFQWRGVVGSRPSKKLIQCQVELEQGFGGGTRHEPKSQNGSVVFLFRVCLKEAHLGPISPLHSFNVFKYG